MTSSSCAKQNDDPGTDPHRRRAAGTVFAIAAATFAAERTAVGAFGTGAASHGLINAGFVPAAAA